MNLRNLFFSGNSSSLARSVIWGVPLLAGTILIGFLVETPLKLFLLLAVIATSFVAYYHYNPQRRNIAARRKIHPLVPVAITYVAVYFALVPYFNPYGVAGFLFGTAFIGGAVILQKHQNDYGTVQRITSWIGAILIVLSVVWIVLAQVQLDDNIIRRFHDEMVRIDPVEYAEAAIGSSTTNLPQEGDWTFTWYKTDNTPVRYYNVKAEISGSKLSFVAKWTDSGEKGTTEMELFRSGCISCYTGDIAVSAAGSVPFSQGEVMLEKKRAGCFTGRASLVGNDFLIKASKEGVPCNV